MPILVRNTPPGFDWAFYSREEPRMHLQTTPDADPPCKVWLERDGLWCIEGDAHAMPPARVLKALRKELSNEQKAWRIRARWVRLMIHKRWLSLHVSADRAIVTAYPGMPHQFQRHVDLSRHAPRSWYASPDDVRLHGETAAIAIGAQRSEDEWVLVDLADLLWA